MENQTEIYPHGVPIWEYHMNPKWVKFWADYAGLPVRQYIDRYQAQIAYEESLGLPDDGLGF